MSVWYCVELTEERLYTADLDDNYSYEDVVDRVKKTSIKVYSRTPFTAEKLAKLECEVQGTKTWLFVHVVDNYVARCKPSASFYVPVCMTYTEYCKQELPYRRWLVKEKAKRDKWYAEANK